MVFRVCAPEGKLPALFSASSKVKPVRNELKIGKYVLIILPSLLCFVHYY